MADQHARTVAEDHGDGVPDEAFDALMEHAQTLMVYEKQMPALLAEPERARSQRIIFWSWRIQSAVALALIVTMHLLGSAGGWYFLVVPHLLATLAGWPLKATVNNHLDRRNASIGLHVLGVLLVLVVLGVVVPWLVAVLVVGWFVVAVAAADGQEAGK
ncbi:hypothetical protein [Streptomyces sp. 43Y-GA-1]|uniref:hypothetical protein n=1 Tax=Streptomyces sp. 43Y-GA-1 TaxID=2939435 RepID=UPI0020C06F3B|nr:hypothetical protein [Streptomyces sp. 43Y-GA-1]MCL6293191.1 hypothetical protein [Streptomyces sp. 43Y-GA-1]